MAPSSSARRLVTFTKMSDTEQQFLGMIDKAITDDPSLVMPADEEQLNRLAKILGIARQGIEKYSEALSQLE